MSQSADAFGSFQRKIPPGDTHPRLVCADCGFIYYENPKLVVGSVCEWSDRVLLCRREIEPRFGYWTIPAGYMEARETTIEGAQREAWEEARARIEIDSLLGVYSIPRISQVQLIYRARLLTPDVEAGDETSEVALFAWDAIPWGELAFPSVRWALRHSREVVGQSIYTPFTNPAGDLGDYHGTTD
ncbi:MAG: NUDIX hydrolase [Gemmatimonadota bacterium]|nr:MAG: NUDIX hydrolase [Gemmatimonadota bacterium]